MIKILQVKYGPEPTSTLRNHKNARIETSTTRRQFNCSLSKQLIHLLLNSGMMSYSCLDIELSEVKEQGRMGPKLKMVTPNHIKHKPVRCNASPLIKIFEKYINQKTADEDNGEVQDCDTSGVLTSTDPFPPSISRTGGDTANSRLLSTWTSLIPCLWMRPLNQMWTTRPWHRPLHRSLLHCTMEPSLWPGLATPSLEGKVWNKPMEDCC